jgi:hypothetical protein
MLRVTAMIAGTLLLAGCGMFSSKEEPPQRQAGQMTVGDATSSAQRVQTIEPTPTPAPALSAEAVPPPAPPSQPATSQPVIVERPISRQSYQPPQRVNQPAPAAANPPVSQPPAQDIPIPPLPSITPAPASPTPQQQYEIPAPTRVPPATQDPPRVFRPTPEPIDIPTPPRNNTPAAPPAYSGPRSGVINWSGQLEKNGTIVLQGDQASAGTLNGRLPGVPVMVELDTREFALAEAPGPSNNWSKLVVRSKNKRHTVVSIRWSVLQ